MTDLLNVFFEVVEADAIDYVSGAHDQPVAVSPKELEVIAVAVVSREPLHQI